jgi:hypothetical protein
MMRWTQINHAYFVQHRLAQSSETTAAFASCQPAMARDDHRRKASHAMIWRVTHAACRVTAPSSRGQCAVASAYGAPSGCRGRAAHHSVRVLADAASQRVAWRASTTAYEHGMARAGWGRQHEAIAMDVVDGRPAGARRHRRASVLPPAYEARARPGPADLSCIVWLLVRTRWGQEWLPHSSMQ